MTHPHDTALSAFEPLFNVAGIFLLVFLAYMVFYKSPIARLWWLFIGPILEPLGFRLVVMDRSFGIHAVRYRPER